MPKNITGEMLKFIAKSPTAFQAIENMSSELGEAGYKRLQEEDAWKVKYGEKYFVTRNSSSIIAFSIGKKASDLRFNITATHGDSPSFKLKEKTDLISGKKYTRLNVENYGGMIMSSWFDRPLSVAGRAVVKDGKGLKEILVNIDRNLILIPNVAIHMERSVNDGYKYNSQTDLMPLFAGNDSPDGFKKLLAKELSVKPGEILGTDLYLYNRQAPAIWGEKKEFISSPRIDNLECAYTSHLALINSKPLTGVINIHACFDNEEVGSSTKQGADSTMLSDVMERICICLGLSREDYLRAISKSFMISADNGHAVHPNHPEHTDATNTVFMNEGVVLKSQASGRYITDGYSAAVIKSLAESAKVPLQFFHNRSDKPGGSTLGNISLSHISLNSADIGLAMLAMHSAYETAGAKDSEYMYSLIKEFYSQKGQM